MRLKRLFNFKFRPIWQTFSVGAFVHHRFTEVVASAFGEKLRSAIHKTRLHSVRLAADNENLWQRFVHPLGSKSDRVILKAVKRFAKQ